MIEDLKQLQIFVDIFRVILITLDRNGLSNLKQKNLLYITLNGQAFNRTILQAYNVAGKHFD